MDTAERQSIRQKNSSRRKPWEDQILREIYDGRDAHAAQLGNDATQIYLDLVKKGKSTRMKFGPVKKSDRAKSTPGAREQQRAS